MRTETGQEQQDIVAKEIEVQLDDVRRTITDSQIKVSELAFPLIGWALLTFLVLDMLGNVLGIPVFTGAIVCNPAGTDNTLIFFAFFLQVAGYAAAGYVLYQSRWRFWWRTLSAPQADDSWSGGAAELVAGRFQSLFTRVTEQSRRLREKTEESVRSIVDAKARSEGPEPEEAGAVSRRPGRALLLSILPFVVMAGIAGAVLYFWPAAILSAVMLALVGVALSLLGDTALASAKPYWRKIKLDYGSLMGLYLGTGAALASLLLIGANELILYPRQAWLHGQYFPFRLMQLCLLCGIVLVVRAQGRVAFRYFTFYRATKPKCANPRAFHVFDFTKLAAWPAYLSFDPDELTKIVVLGRRQDRHYAVLDHSIRLPLMRQPYTVLNLHAWQGRIGLDATATGDSGDFFQATAKWAIMPRSFEALHSSMMAKLGNIIPERPMAVFLQDLFQSDSPRLLLDRILKRTVEGYAGEHSQTARDLRECYAGALSKARERGLLTPAELTPTEEMGHGGPGSLSLSIVGYEQLRAVRDSLNLMIEEPKQRWRSYRLKRLKAKQVLPQMFRAQLRRHFVNAIGVGEGKGDVEVLNETIDCLLECSGIELEIEAFDFAPGAAAECEQMMETIDKEFAEKFDAIEARLQERETKLLEFFQTHVAQMESGKREVVAQLIQTAPQVLPFLLQNPVGQDFVRFLLSLGESALKDKLGKLRDVNVDDPDLEARVREVMKSRLNPTNDSTGPKKKAGPEEDPVF